MALVLTGLLALIPGISTILGLFAPLIPGVVSLISSIETSKYNAQVAMFTAKLGGNRDAAIAIVNAAAASQQASVGWLAVIAGSAWLTALVILFATPVLAYLWKDIGYDVVVGALNGCSKGTMAVLKTTLAAADFTKHVAECAIYSTDEIQGQAADYGHAIIYSIFGSGTVLAGAGIAERMMRNASK